MGREISGATGVDFAEKDRQVRILMTELEEDIDPATPVEDLRLGQQQIVEIARAQSVDSRILIMDEPTSALSATEVEVLFKVIRDLTDRGVSIVYISHHLEAALQITNHTVVLRDGAMTAWAPRADIDLNWIVHNMVGENYDLGSPPTGHAMGDVAPSVRNLTVADPRGGDCNVVDRLSLDVRAGEILCIYGLIGAGRTELLETVGAVAGICGRGGVAGARGVAPVHRGTYRAGAGAGARRPAARRSGADDDRGAEPVAGVDHVVHAGVVQAEMGRTGPN